MKLDPAQRASLASAWNCKLTTRGRKSGQPRQTTIWFAEGEGFESPADSESEVFLYLTGNADEPQWCRNIRACPDVEIEIAGVHISAKAQVIQDEAEAQRIRDRFVARYALAKLGRLWGAYKNSVALKVE